MRLSLSTIKRLKNMAETRPWNTETAVVFNYQSFIENSESEFRSTNFRLKIQNLNLDVSFKAPKFRI